MTPYQYLKANSKLEVSEMAVRADSSYGYFEQIARGRRTPSIKKAKLFIHASDGAMTLEELIPAIAA
jgi:hypothetical protein